MRGMVVTRARMALFVYNVYLSAPRENSNPAEPSLLGDAGLDFPEAAKARICEANTRYIFI